MNWACISLFSQGKQLLWLPDCSPAPPIPFEKGFTFKGKNFIHCVHNQSVKAFNSMNISWCLDESLSYIVAQVLINGTANSLYVLKFA